MDFEGVGKIIFDPLPDSGNAKKLFKPYWGIIKCDDDIDDYYRWFLERRFNLILSKPAFGPHITIFDGETPKDINKWELLKKRYNNSEVNFKYDIFTKSNGKHWWLKCYCDEIQSMREKLEFKSHLKWSLHLTLGIPIARHVEHSEYIYRLEMNKTRKPE